MKKHLQSKFEIRLTFDRETENPSRLFKSFADMIDGVNSLDYLIAESVNTKVSSKIYLDDIEKGSLIAKLWNALVISDDDQIDNSPVESEIEDYIEESRSESLKFIAEGKSSVEDLENLKTKIQDIAKTKNLPDTLNYAEPDSIKLATTINKLNDATDNLDSREAFEIKSPNHEIKGIKSGNSKINIEDVENSLTTSEIINESEAFYLIKKPDFLGDSAWSFKHGKKSVSVKISDEKWLGKFQTGEIIVVPGDSLKVTIRQTCKYNKNGYLISDKTEIIDVIDVIHN